MNGGLVGDHPPGAPARWSDFGRRALSAAFLAPIALLCIWVGGVPFEALIVLAALGLSVEWVVLCRAPALSQAARKALLAAGLLYIGLPLVCLLWLRGAEGGRESVLFLVLVVWASDIGAYMVGRLVGGPKLAPSLSPGKTRSGAVGGLAAALIVGWLMPSGTAVLAVLLGVACQAGDLLESAIKRHVGVKDSGRLIPGHGGLLDRLDGLMAAAPVAALAMLVSRGGHW